MKVLRAVMLASVCALTTAGSTYAPLLDIESSDTNIIVAGIPAARQSGVVAPDAVEPVAAASTTWSVAEAPITAIAATPTTTVAEAPTTSIAETPTMTTLTEITEIATTTTTTTSSSN